MRFSSDKGGGSGNGSEETWGRQKQKQNAPGQPRGRRTQGGDARSDASIKTEEAIQKKTLGPASLLGALLRRDFEAGKGTDW